MGKIKVGKVYCWTFPSHEFMALCEDIDSYIGWSGTVLSVSGSACAHKVGDWATDLLLSVGPGAYREVAVEGGVITVPTPWGR